MLEMSKIYDSNSWVRGSRAWRNTSYFLLSKDSSNWRDQFFSMSKTENAVLNGQGHRGVHESWITFNNIKFNSVKWLTLQVWWWEIGGTRIGKTGQGLQGESHQYGSLPTDNNSGTHPGLRWNSMGISSLASCWLHWAEATGAIIETIMFQLYFWNSLPFLLNSRSCQEWNLTMVSTLTKGVILNSTFDTVSMTVLNLSTVHNGFILALAWPGVIGQGVPSGWMQRWSKITFGFWSNHCFLIIIRLGCIFSRHASGSRCRKGWKSLLTSSLRWI